MSAKQGVPQRSHKPGVVADPAHWQDLAACRGADPEMFFDTTRYAQALLFCLECPVTEQCKKLRRSSDGVWGGKTFTERKRPNAGTGDFVKHRPGHGDEAGYMRHLRAKEPACPACLEGAAAAKRRQKDNRRAG